MRQKKKYHWFWLKLWKRFFKIIFFFFFQKVSKKKGKGTPIFRRNFPRIIEIFQKYLQIDSLSAYLTFSLLIISKIEHEKRPKIYKFRHYTTGLEVIFARKFIIFLTFLTFSLAN